MSLSGQRAPLYFLGAILVLALVWLWLKPIAPRADSEFRIYPKQGAQLEAWLSPGPDSAGWELESGYISQSYGTYVFTHKSKAQMVLELHHVDAATGALFQTLKFTVVHTGGSVDEELTESLQKSLKEQEGAWVWTQGRSDPTPLLLRRFLNLQVPVALLLLVLMPFCILGAYRSLWRDFSETWGFPWRGLFIALLMAGVMRLGIAPLRMVILYIGYDLTDAAITLNQVPRYGAGVPVFHHGILEVFGGGHRTLLWTHAVLGLLTLPLWAGLVHRLFKSTSGAVFFAFAWALLPMAVAHDTSEANTVPILWWLGAACILFLDGVERKSVWSLLGATILAALCMVSRPEFGLLVPAVFVVLGLHNLKGEFRWFFKTTWPLIVATLVLVIPQAMHLGSRANLLMDSQSLPLRASSAFNQFSFFDPQLTPFGLWPLFLVAVLLKGSWKRVLPWLLLSTLATALTWADLCPANITRVQVPALLFAMIVVSFGAARTLVWIESRPWRGFAKGAFSTALVVGLLASAIPATARIWTPTYEDYEERLIRETSDLLQQDDILVRLGYRDVGRPEKGSVVHLHFPDYLFDGPGIESRVRDIGDWLDNPKEGRAYFLLSVRCYTPDVPVRTRAPMQMPMRAACRTIMENYVQEPLFERRLRAVGDPNQTGYYGLGTDHTIKVGLYLLHHQARPVEPPR